MDKTKQLWHKNGFLGVYIIFKNYSISFWFMLFLILVVLGLYPHGWMHLFYLALDKSVSWMKCNAVLSILSDQGQGMWKDGVYIVHLKVSFDCCWGMLLRKILSATKVNKVLLSVTDISAHAVLLNELKHKQCRYFQQTLKGDPLTCTHTTGDRKSLNLHWKEKTQRLYIFSSKHYIVSLFVCYLTLDNNANDTQRKEG